MGRKFRLYRDSGVREYWVLSPEGKTLDTYLFQDDLIRFRSYSQGEKAGVGIFPDFAVDLGAVFAE